MILNNETAALIRINANRLAEAIHTKEELTDLATATTYEQVFSAIESLLIHTHMFFDEDLLLSLEQNNWETFKGLLMIYTLNAVNKRFGKSAAKSIFENQQSEDSGPQIL